jgi:peptidoglycan/LPS O-acetylase OafA/YrhL
MTMPAATSRFGAPPIQRGAWLDALRFIVACLIVVYHYQAAAPVPLVQLHPVFGRGYLLTDFFLIDSGYVLARIYGAQVAAGRMTLGTFFRKRFLRVVPAHLIMSTVLVGLVLAAEAIGVSPRHGQWFDWSQLPAQLLLVQAFGVPGGLGWNAPTWSVSALLGCYLAFPLLLRAARRFSGWEALAAGVCLYGIADLLAWRLLGYPVYEMPMKYGVWRALPLFMGGVVLARVSDTLYIPPRLAAILGLAAVLGLALVNDAGDFGLASLALIGAIILAAGAIPVARPSRLVEKAAMVSFAMFITNEVVRIAWFGVVNVLQARFDWSQPVQWGLWACGPLLAVAFAVAFYGLVDAPSQRRLNRAPARSGEPSRLRQALASLLPHPEAKDFADVFTRRGYVEVAISKGPLDRG